MKSLFTAAALAATVFALSPASAAKTKMMSCTSANMAKVNTMMQTMPPSEQKAGMDQEFSMANAAMVKGDMRDCNKHFSKMQGMMKPGA